MRTVDYLLTNAIVLTMDDLLTQYEPGAVAVSGDHIVAVGPQDEILSAYTARKHRLQWQSSDAGSDQFSYPCPNDPSERPGG
jgi:predicted amidohydrolase YtcJ